MRIATRFAAKFADSIVATLNCVDRMIFKGYLPGVHPLYFSVRNVIFGLGWRSRWIWVANQSKR